MSPRRFLFSFGTHDDTEVPKRRKVHSHEGEKCPEVQQLSGVLVGIAHIVKSDCATHGDKSNEDDVIGRGAASAAEVGKEPFRQHAIAAHSKEQARRAETSCKPASDRGQNKDCSIA